MSQFRDMAYGFEPKPEAVGPPDSTEWAYRFPGTGDVPLQTHLTEIGKNRLKKAISSVTYPIPGDMKRVYRKAVSAPAGGSQKDAAAAWSAASKEKVGA